MAIRFSCPACSQSASAPDSAAGKKARCPYCQAVVTVPAASLPPPPAPEANCNSRPAARAIYTAPPELAKPPNMRIYVVGGMAGLALVAVIIAVWFMVNSGHSRETIASNDDGSAATGQPAPASPAPRFAPAVPAASPRPSGPAVRVPTAIPSPPRRAVATPVTPAPTPAATPRPIPVATPVSVIPQIEYVHVVLEARKLARFTASEANLRRIHQAIQQHEISNSSFPSDLSEVGLEDLRSPNDNSRKYVYITGQKPGVNLKNILAYDPSPYRNVAMAILRVDGTVEGVHLNDLKDALKNQKAKEGEMPK